MKLDEKITLVLLIWNVIISPFDLECHHFLDLWH